MASADVIDTLIAEAGGEGDAGLIAAAWAIQQRAAARGQTVDQVIKSGFDGYSNPGSGAVKAQQDPRLRARVEQIMTGVQNGSIPNPVPGADHFLSGDVQPSWLKGMKPVATIGGHRFYASGNVPQSAYGPLIPPGELPEVATALSTVPTPRAPVPVTQSIDLGQYRNNVAPSQLGPETFARLSRPRRTLGDELGMSPIPGGQQQAPMFDAAYDERTGTMRLTREPIDSQGMAVGSSRPPAPVPAIPSAHIAAHRATDRVLQAELNRRNPAQLPALPPPMGQPPATRVVQSVPVRPAGPGNLATAQSEQAIQRRVAPPVTRLPSTQPIVAFPTTQQIVAATGFRPPPAIPGPNGYTNPDKDMAQLAATGGLDYAGSLGVQPPTTQVAAPRVAPVPFQRPTAVGTQLSVRPMPPMPIARPGIGGPFRIAPQPMPASMRPYLGVPQLSSPIQRAAQAVSQSGDTSVGNQADAAAARASGEAGRNRRY